MTERKHRSTGAGVDIFTPAAPAEMPEPTAADFHAADRRNAPAPGRPPRPPKPVRFTVDLDPGLHQYLREYTTAFGTKASVIVRELLAELRDDPELAARIQARIWQPR